MVISKVKKKLLVFTLIIVIVFISIIIAGQSTLVVTSYSIETEKTNASFRFALISDLHNKEFGKGNQKLIETISDQKPEFIIIAGDMILKQTEDYSVMESLVKALVKIAPVYYTFGNHELEMGGRVDLEKIIENCGAKVLNNEMVTFKKAESEIIIGGLKNYPFFDFQAPDYDNDERWFLEEFLKAQEETFSLLVCHYPETYTWRLEKFDIDLMLCGHTHGGIIRLPYFGGLYSPNQGYFADYDKGYFDGETADMIISSGLGNSNFLPRINNPPEICMITIN